MPPDESNPRMRTGLDGGTRSRRAGRITKKMLREAKIGNEILIALTDKDQSDAKELADRAGMTLDNWLHSRAMAGIRESLKTNDGWILLHE